MIRAGIVGATGYGGRELLRLLGVHPEAGVAAATSTTAAGESLDDVLPGFRKLTTMEFQPFGAESLARSCDVVFVGVPGAESMGVVSELRAAGARVVDIGADFRLKSTKDFAHYYGREHTAPELLQEAVYGLPPLYREELAGAQLVAAPGCYSVTGILPLKPLVDAVAFDVPAVMDSVSGVSGAGKSLKEGFHFPEMNENVWAYKVGVHQHVPEIEQELDHKILVQFSPHVGPYTRGILSTITVRPSAEVDVDACYARYEDEPFVRVLGEGNLPEIKYVRGSNFCDIGWVRDDRTGNLVVVSAVDNLMGGTAGLAIQCMNIMFGLDEVAGLQFGGMSI